MSRIVVLKLRTGETVIARLVAEDPGTLTLEKPYLVERTQIYPWLFATTQGDRVTLSVSDLLLPPLPPKETLTQTYLEASSGLTIPRGGLNPSSTRGGGGPPPTRGGAGGGPVGPVQ